MPLAFANQNSSGITSTGRTFSNDNLWNCNLTSIMAQNKRPLIGVKRRQSEDTVFIDESPSPKRCFNDECQSSSLNYNDQMFCKNFSNSSICEDGETSKALIPLNRNLEVYNNDEEMEGIDVINSLNFSSSPERYLMRGRNQFPLIPSHLVKGNEIVLFKPEHPVNFYRNLENEEEDLLRDDDDRSMEGRIEELPNDYEVDSNNSNNAHINDYSNKSTNGIHLTTIKECSLGVVELVEDDDDLSVEKNNVSSLSYSSTPLHCTIYDNSTEIEAVPVTTYNQQLSHGPIFEELSDEDYSDTSVKDDSPMEVD